jgi:hypothetical protein
MPAVVLVLLGVLSVAGALAVGVGWWLSVVWLGAVSIVAGLFVDFGGDA